MEQGLRAVMVFLAVVIGVAGSPGGRPRDGVSGGAVGPGPAESAQSERAVVYVVPIEGLIDLGLAPFVRRVLDDAETTKAAVVVLEIDTFGGRVDAAVQIRDALLRTKVRTLAFVNKRAISAGALIGLAAMEIAMAEGGTIGAATPVQVGGGGETKPVEEKTVSYMRKEFRATAEARNRPPLVAEAMVDPDIAIPDVIEMGKLLTLTTSEALKLGIAGFRADNLEEVLKHMELAGAAVRRSAPNWAENLVRFLTHPVLSSLLMTVGILGLIIEIRTPGFGLPGILGITSLALFFWGHWLVRLAGWEEVLLVASGILLLALEIFVIPGFGVAGVLGIAAVLGGLGLSLVGAGATWATVGLALGRVALSLGLAVAGAAALLTLVPRLPYGRRLILSTELLADQGFTSPPEADRAWLGTRGTAASPLRPAGIARIEGRRVDVVSDGEYIDPGVPIEVVRVEGNRIVVREVRQPKESEP
jgi:membrane-bound serine protease (ClpP class)